MKKDKHARMKANVESNNRSDFGFTGYPSVSSTVYKTDHLICKIMNEKNIKKYQFQGSQVLQCPILSRLIQSLFPCTRFRMKQLCHLGFPPAYTRPNRMSRAYPTPPAIQK